MKGWFRRSRLEEEMEEELLAHIEARASDLEASGLPRPEALRRARLEFGGYRSWRPSARTCALASAPFGSRPASPRSPS
jgi:hypothetical protein